MIRCGNRSAHLDARVYHNTAAAVKNCFASYRPEALMTDPIALTDQTREQAKAIGQAAQPNILAHLTDHFLTWDAATSHPMSRGPIRRAELLLKVPAEVREDILAESNTMVNMYGGRPSDAVEDTVSGYLLTGEVPNFWRKKADHARRVEAEYKAAVQFSHKI